MKYRSRLVGQIGQTMNKVGTVSGVALRRFGSSGMPSIIKGGANALGLALAPMTDGASVAVAGGVDGIVDGLTSKTALGLADGIQRTGAFLQRFA
jgi:hypothetical protein